MSNSCFKSQRLIRPSLLVLWSSHGPNTNGQFGCSSFLSVWERSSSSASASGICFGAGCENDGFGLFFQWGEMRLTWMKCFAVDSSESQTIEHLWEDFFAHPSQWWDNRVGKVSPGLLHS
jgi:hypothetical protein